jgi:hypothetical protein
MAGLAFLLGQPTVVQGNPLGASKHGPADDKRSDQLTCLSQIPSCAESEPGPRPAVVACSNDLAYPITGDISSRIDHDAASDIESPGGLCVHVYGKQISSQICPDFIVRLFYPHIF